jgi:hypothetical protein
LGFAGAEFSTPVEKLVEKPGQIRKDQLETRDFTSIFASEGSKRPIRQSFARV